MAGRHPGGHDAGVFVNGITLSERHYRETVAPLLGALPHTAARLGAGSEVLGFDTPRSTDHDWGPRLLVFVERPEGLAFPGAEVTTLESWFDAQLGFDPRRGVSVADWLATPTQVLAETTCGAVFHDGLGSLGPARAALAWYPTDVWRYVLAGQWRRISQEEAFVGRCAEVGDQLGAAVVAGRLVRDLMRLCLLMERRYPPYSKWLGSAFGALPVSLGSLLTAAITDSSGREEHLAAAYTAVASRHNALGLTEPVDPATRPYHSRPYQVLHAERFVAALMAAVTDPEVRGLPAVGAVDQYVDSSDLLCDRPLTRAVGRGFGRP